MGALSAGLSMIIGKIVAAIAWIGKLFVAIFVSLWDILKDIFSWVVEQFLQIGVSAAGSLDVGQMQSAGQWWSGLPSDVLNILGLIGFGTATSIIAAAISIRLVLQLIPFTRLGS